MIKTNFRGVMLGVASRPYEYNGRSGVGYDLSVKQDGTVGTIACDKSVFEAYTSGVLKDYVEYKFACVFDEKYRRFRVIDAVSVGKA